MAMTVKAIFLIELIEYRFNKMLNVFLSNLPLKTTLRGFCKLLTIFCPLCYEELFAIIAMPIGHRRITWGMEFVHENSLTTTAYCTSSYKNSSLARLDATAEFIANELLPELLQIASIQIQIL